MVDRTVTVRLRLDSTQWVAGQSAAVTANGRLAASAQATASAAQRDAQRTASAVSGTFTGMARTGEAALGRLDAVATASSQALARSTTAMTAQTAAAAAAASRTTAQAATTAGAATTQANATAAASTRQVTAAAGEIPAAFRAAATGAASALGTVDAAATAASAAVTQASVGMSAATASAAAGTATLSLATRLALGEAAQSSAATAAAATAAAARVSTATHLATAGATNAAAAAAAATARADATTAALGSTFGATAARASAFGSAVVTAAGRSEQSLKTTRTASLLLVAAFGLAVYASSKFETAMSGVKAATQSSGRELDSLRQAAIDAGASTQYSATQAANAETELAKAGVSTADILGGALKGTLSLAAAGQMDVADSAVVAAKAMNSFGLTGSDMAHIADVIAAAAGKSATDVHGLSLALAQSALLAHQTGLTLEQTAGALALFAQNGLVGSDAGTSLKTMLMRLTPQSQEARDMMNQLGFSAYDSSGKFVGLSETAARMQKAFSGLTPEARNAAMGVIFGSDAIRAATIVSQAGAAGIDTWTKAANDSGYAARYAATQSANLAGDLQRLKSAFETALIQSGTAANGVLRDMAQELTALIRWYSALPPGVQQSVTVLGGMVGVVTLVASGLLLMLPRIMATKRELVSLGLTAARTNTLMAGLGRLGVVAGVLTALTLGADKLTEAMKKPAPNVAELTNSLVDLVKSGTKTGDTIKDLDGFGDAVARIAHPSTLNRLDDIASSVGHLGLTDSKVGSLTESKDMITALDKSLTDLVQSGAADTAAKAFTIYAAEATKAGTSTSKLKSLLPQYTNALATADTTQKLAAGSQTALGDAAATTADDLQDTRTEAEKLTDTLSTLNGVNIDAASAAISYQQNLADLRKSFKDNGTSMDITTDKGRKNKQAFLDAADGAQKYAEAVATQTGSQAEGNRVLAQNIESLKRQMLAAGISKQAVDSLLASYATLPTGVTTTIHADDQASKELAAIQAQLEKTKGKTVTVKALTSGAEQALKDLGFTVTHLKTGQVKVTVPTSGAKAAIDSVRDYLSTLTNTPHTATINIVTTHSTSGVMAHEGGGYANGGTVSSVHRAAAGLFVPGYAPRQDTVRALLSPGEGVLVPETVSKLGALTGLGRAGVVKQLNLWGRYGSAMRFADGGVVSGGVQRFASGGFTYTPTAPGSTLGGAGSGMDRYTADVGKLSDAWKVLYAAIADQTKKTAALRAAEDNLGKVRADKHHTAAELTSAEKKLADARTASAKANSKVAYDQKVVNSADAALGLKAGAKTPSGFNLAAYNKELAAAAKANAAWEKNLSSIGKRAGGDVEQTLRDMGEDGQALVAALAKASGKSFTDIVNNLKALAPTAKATLADYTAQLKVSTATSKTFQADLLKLASMGYGDLAAQLAGQGDDAAAAIAAAAVKSPGAASSANTAAAAAASTLSADDLSNALTLIGVLKAKPGAGISDVLAAGLDLATVKALLPKIQGQLAALPVSDTATFLAQMAGQGGATAMARGGILTRPTAVLAAEAGATESWIPWNNSARSASLLSATAAGMGYQLVPAGRYAGSGGESGAGSTVTHNHRSVTLHGAKQSSAEQLHDVVRTMQFIG